MIAGVAVRSIGFLAFLGVLSTTALADRKLLHGEFRDFDGVRKRVLVDLVRGIKICVIGSSDNVTNDGLNLLRGCALRLRVAVLSIGFLAFLGVFFVRSTTALADRKLLHGEFRDFDGVRKRAMLVGFEVVRGRKIGVVGSSDNVTNDGGVLGGVLGGVIIGLLFDSDF